MPRSAVFIVTMSRASAQSVTVDYATVPGTAMPPGDFTPVSGTLTFAPGQTSKQITVPIRATTPPGTPAEQFSVSLSAPVNATIADATGVAIIPAVAAIVPPVISIDNVQV